ncbi:MAG: hypothetical protein A2W25_12410 [candidate division Zixibacteria bacterium RBG_16_53_22]|nr:MAG: hypothetical protein A2W25_12410 [candidate division Zixibacteria bacterium RBG_16_53_22]
MKHLKSALKIILVGVIFYFLFRNLLANWNEFEKMGPHFNFLHAALAFLAVMAAWVMSAWCWGRVLNAFGHQVPYRDVFIIYFKANLGKYLPGKIWQIVGSAYFAADKGIPEGVSITTSLIGQAYSVLSGISLFAASLLSGLISFGDDLSLMSRWSAVPVLIILLLVAIRPDLGQPLMNWAMKLIKRQQVRIRLPIARAVELFFLYLICWFIFGFGLWLFSNALTPVEIQLYIPMTAILAAAVAIGFLALFAPGGLGVREGVIALFLASVPGFPAPLPAAVAVGYRIIMTIAELIAFGLTWVIKWI